MEINEIVRLASEYDSLSSNKQYAEHFLQQVGDKPRQLSVLSNGAEMDVHHTFIGSFKANIDQYITEVDARMVEIKELLEGVHAKGQTEDVSHTV